MKPTKNDQGATIWPEDLDLRGKTVRLANGREVTIPLEAERESSSSYAIYHTASITVCQNGPRYGGQCNEVDVVEILDEPQEGTLPDTAAPPAPTQSGGRPAGRTGWWLAEQPNGDRAAMAARCIDFMRATEGRLYLSWGDDHAGAVKLDSLRHTTDPDEVIAWLRGEAGKGSP